MLDFFKNTQEEKTTMASSEAHKRANIKWQAANYRRVPLDVRKEYYTDVLKPAADKAGETVGGFIKKAIAERIERLNERS